MVKNSWFLDEQSGKAERRVEMTTEEMRQKASEARREAKALQQKLQTLTDADERKQLARQINDLFNEAATLRNEAKHRYYQAESIERDFRCIEAGLED